MGELVLGRQLLLGDAQAGRDLLVVVGASPDQARAQRLERRRGDEDLYGLGQRGPDLAGALDLDLEDDGMPGLGTALELAVQGAVTTARVDRVLDELAGLDAALEVRVVEEVVVDTVLLAGARRARRGRDAELEFRHALAQGADQRALADARRTRDDEDARHRASLRRVADGAPLAAQHGDQLGALALRESADGLARRDPTLLEHLVRLHAPVLRDGQQHVADLRGLDVLGRLPQQRVNRHPARLQILLQLRPPRADRVGALQRVHALKERSLGCRRVLRRGIGGRRHRRRYYTA